MTESTFRIKKSRDNSKQELIGGTLDSVHQQVLSKLKEDNLDNTDINKEIEKLESLLNNTSNSLELSLIYKQIQNLKLKLIKNNNLEFYYLKNSDIFLKYYSEDSNIKTSLNNSSGNNSNTFMKFLKSTEQTNTTSQQSRKQIFDEYLSRQKLTDGSETTNNIDIEHCSNCNIAREEYSSEGILICPKCGSEEFLMVVNDFAGFRDPPKERNNYAYKKINHLNEILNQFQAKQR
jgi:uncharacterized Zn finger protein (UPF0148 family)